MKRKARAVENLYEKLLRRYGPQGWWPVLSLAGQDGFDDRGYHVGDYRHPKTEPERFEVILGSILTQNTSWKNAELALRALHARNLLLPEQLARLDPATLAELIRPSRYYNQKARKIGALLAHLSEHKSPTREGLLGVWGIGPETADSILLYAFHQPVFVVDAYTRRILGRFGFVEETASYAEVQALFHRALPPEPPLFNEYHALIVEHGKRFYTKKPYGAADPLL